MHITQLFDPLIFCEHIEVVVLGLPERAFAAP
jgi:hypothetical protein